LAPGNPSADAAKINARRAVSTTVYWLCTVSAALGGAFIDGLFAGGILAFVLLTGLLVARLFERSAFNGRVRSVDALSHKDELTGLPNRRAFFEELHASLGRPLKRDEFTAVFFIDLDRFKTINDTFGHFVGDQFLLAISGRLQRCVPHGAILARLGGDEFTVLIHSVKTRDEVLRLAEDLMGVFNEPVMVRSHELWANASIGIVMTEPPRPKADDLLSMADTALYHAKAQGKGQFVLFEPDLARPTSERPSLDGELRYALSRRELELHFQPVVDLSSSRIAGFEALVRWRHPRLGLIPPNVFIPIAEETGVIRSLGAWILESACRQALALQNLYGETLTISVNLSALQFRQRDILSQIEFISGRTGLPPGALQLEITETILMQDSEQTVKNLAALRELGFRIAIDDFGVGFSSLNYLKRFEVDCLKIDRSFLSDLNNPRNAALLRGTILLGHNLGMMVVAEGIETHEQRLFLTNAGCDYGQGFLLGRPMDEKQLNDRLSVYGLEVELPEPAVGPIPLVQPRQPLFGERVRRAA